MNAIQLQDTSQTEGDPCSLQDNEPSLPQRINSQDYSTFDIVEATKYGILQRVVELVENGADVNEPDNETVSLLHWAAINCRLDIIKYLLSKGAIVDAIGGDLQSTPLHWAIRQGHLNTVVALMKAGADPSVRDYAGFSCIHRAAQFGYTHIVAYLVAKGTDPNMPDSCAMTPLMWSAYKVNSLNPTQLLLTLGASHSPKDSLHGNTALHWAIIAKNSIPITTLVQHGASLTATNSNNETPMTLLGPHIGEAWLGHEFIQEFRQRQRRSKVCCRNKKIRWYCMTITPFLAFYALGMIFHSELNYLLKFAAAVALGLSIYTANKYIYDERLFNVLPMSIYLATKVSASKKENLEKKSACIAKRLQIWLYVTWIFWLRIHATWYLWTLLIGGSIPLWFCYFKSWRGDPGVVKATPDEKLNYIVELAENGGFESHLFCRTCLVRKPLRSKHCTVCDVCIAKFDHHCPFINNCIVDRFSLEGAQNHKYFLGFLMSLFGLCILTLVAIIRYWRYECWTNIKDAKSTDDYLFAAMRCDAWIMWVTLNISFHLGWVGLLLACQCYQITALGMTTNERINANRYRHFRKGNPFHRGAIQNIADFCECDFCGVSVKPRIDWLHAYELKQTNDEKFLDWVVAG
ncbi:palmitoyltransferase Hip14-like isoform X2 [Phymastichus coffea]|nr:palmitoyltransferase Hip14-like isoform X2 [Phymastichus coffea]